MTAEGDRILAIEAQDDIDGRVFEEILNRQDKARDYGTRLSAFAYLTEPWLSTTQIAELVGIDDSQMFALSLTEGPIPQEAKDVINKLYTVSALVWKESDGIDDFNLRVAASRKKLTKPLSTLRVDPEDPSSPDRSILQAIRDGNMETVLSLADTQLGSQEITARSN